MRIDVTEGQEIVITLPYSEVCVSMRVAGEHMGVRVLEHGMAQLLNADGTPYSFPITHGEAGIYSDAQGLFIDVAAGKPFDATDESTYAHTVSIDGVPAEEYRRSAARFPYGDGGPGVLGW